MRLDRTCGAIVALLLFWAQAVPAAGIDPALLEAARKEGQAVWYTGLIVNQIVRPMVEAFETAYPGITVHYARASDTETAVKLLNEGRARRIQADVFDATNAIFPLLDAKLVAAYAPRAAQHYPAELKDPDGYWTASNLYFLTVAANTNLVPPDAMPRNFVDLLDPRWKGRMAWTSELAPRARPASSTTSSPSWARQTAWPICAPSPRRSRCSSPPRRARCSTR